MNHRGRTLQEILKIQNSDLSQNMFQTGKSSLGIITDPQQSLASSRLMHSHISTESNNENKNGKRLKLKDYLHLASLQKKSKSINRISANKSQLDISSPTTFIPTSSVPSINNKPESGITNNNKFNSVRKEGFIQQIKQDINLKIERQIKQLQDLKRFVETNFQQNKSSDETRVFMFQFYNTVKDNCQRYDHLGKKIHQFEGKGQKDRSKTEINYWEVSDQQLSSPAKMVQRGLGLTYDAFQKMNFTAI